ncbi:TPA: hypothetical protein ACSTJY_004807, partial [Serratia fonticola]
LISLRITRTFFLSLSEAVRSSSLNTLPFSFLHHFPKSHELIKGSGQPPRPLGEGWGEGKQTTLELALQGNDQKEAEISAGKMVGCKMEDKQCNDFWSISASCRSCPR